MPQSVDFGTRETLYAQKRSKMRLERFSPFQRGK